MFAVHVSNPFTSKSRQEDRDRKIMENHRSDREQRDATRKAAWESKHSPVMRTYLQTCTYVFLRWR